VSNKSPKLTPTRTDFTSKAAAAQLSSPLACDTMSRYWLFGEVFGLDQTRHSPAGTLGGMLYPVHPDMV